MVLDEGEGGLGFDVTGDDEHDIFRAVEAFEEREAVVELAGHDHNVAFEANRGVFVGVGVVREVLQALVQQREGA